MNREETKGVGEGGVAEADTERIWCVYDKTQGDVESYHPSYAWAWERLKRFETSRPVNVDAAIRETRATFRGLAYRVVATAWDGYRWMLHTALGSREAALGEWVLRRVAMGTCRPHRKVRAEMKLLLGRQLPARRLPAHALDVPEVVAIGGQEYRDGPILARAEAFGQAAEQNRRHLADGAAWDGQWCLVVELSDPLPSVRAPAEFANALGVEGHFAHRAVRLVHPTDAELARFNCAATVV